LIELVLATLLSLFNQSLTLTLTLMLELDEKFGDSNRTM